MLVNVSIPKSLLTQTNASSKNCNKPYPFFSTTTSSSFFSFFDQFFKKESQHIGFMPCTKPIPAPLDSTHPIDCYYSGKNDDSSDNISSFSSSSSSSSSDYSLFDEEDNTSTLSDLLCEHYVKTKMDSKEDDMTDIPLETFKVFEAPSKSTTNWIMGKSITSLYSEAKEWTLITQEVTEPSVETPEPVQPREHRPRDIRLNPDYLRMIVAEVNMMRAEKIIGPLKERRILSKRSDPFVLKPSPLQFTV